VIARLGIQLLHGAVVIGAGDDLIVHPATISSTVVPP